MIGKPVSAPLPAPAALRQEGKALTEAAIPPALVRKGVPPLHRTEAWLKGVGNVIDVRV